MSNLLQDIKQALRGLRKDFGFTAAVILAMALGIGANTAIFSVVNSVLLRPLPFGNPDQLVQVWEKPPQRQFPGISEFPVSPANYRDWQSQSRSFDKMAIAKRARYDLTGSGEPMSVDAEAVSGEFFSVLQAKPEFGRIFMQEEDQQGRNLVVILGHALWQQHFGSDAKIVGQTIRLDDQKYTVIGIMDSAFSYPSTAQLWTPLTMTDQERAVRGERHFSVIARLKPGVDLKQAQAEMNTITGQIAQSFPAEDAEWGAALISLREDLVGDVRPTLLILMGAVGFVLLIACANVANLGMARTLNKRKDVAIRKALGASRGRVIQQVVSESVLLSLAGGALGLFLARFGTTLIVKFLGSDLPNSSEFELSWQVLVFTLLISVATGLLAGFIPAWNLTKINMNEALKQGLGRSGSDAGDRRTRAILVVSEVALSLMLLIGAGLMTQSLWRLRAVDRGFETAQTVTMRLAIANTKFDSPARQAEFTQEVLLRTRAMPSIEAAGAIDSLPLKRGSIQPIEIQGQPTAPGAKKPVVSVRLITPGYRDTLRIPLIKGRDFNDADTADRPPVVLISASLAKRFWQNENPIGQHVTLAFFPDKVREVVGVIGEVKQQNLTAPGVSPTLYVPVSQVSAPAPALGKWRSFPLSLVVRTSPNTNPSSIVPQIIQNVRQLDSQLPVEGTSTLEDYVEDTISKQRFNMLLLNAFAGMALVLTTLGIYSVLSYTVRRRSREIGIRMALGARVGNVLRMVVMDGLKPTIAGVVLGVGGALLLGRVLASVIYGVSTTDVATFAVGALSLMGVSVLASLAPAYRATRVQPVETLRED